MPKMRTALIVKDGIPVNAVVLPADPAKAASYCANFDGNTVIPDPEDEYGTDFVTVSGCIAVDVTDEDPRPGVGNGWTFFDGVWVATVEPEPS